MYLHVKHTRFSGEKANRVHEEDNEEASYTCDQRASACNYNSGLDAHRRTLHAHRNVRAEKENEWLGQKETRWKGNSEDMNKEELALRIISNQYKIERILEYFKNAIYN